MYSLPLVVLNQQLRFSVGVLALDEAYLDEAAGGFLDAGLEDHGLVGGGLIVGAVGVVEDYRVLGADLEAHGGELLNREGEGGLGVLGAVPAVEAVGAHGLLVPDLEGIAVGQHAI